MEADEALGLFAERFFSSVPPGTADAAVPSATGASAAFLALALARRGGPRAVLAVAPGMPDADRLAADVAELLPQDVELCEFPGGAADDRSAAGCRAKTAASLRRWKDSPHPCIVVAPSAALELRVAEPSAVFGAQPGKTTFDELSRTLASFGYKRVPLVGEEGEWAVRGGLVDAWSPGEPSPVRLEFEGDVLDGIRPFDASTQRSAGAADSASFIPLAEESGVEGGAVLAGLMPPGFVLLALEHGAYKPPAAGGAALRVWTGEPPPPDAAQIPFATLPLPGFGELDQSRAHHPELFEEARARLARHLESARSRGEPVFQDDPLSGGFELPPSDDGTFKGLVVTAKADRVFVKQAVRRGPRRQSPRGARIEDFEELEPGELVVHLDYGVGRYLGSSRISVGGGAMEVYTVEYADGAKLHVPAHHANLLTRYVGVKGKKAELGRIDGKKWNSDKQKAKEAVEDLAASLIETQARREAMPGFACEIDVPGKEAFCAAFPFEETEDQLAAIRDVENDLAAPRPMDRLVCGDAGFGKTEVAVRAAFIEAMNGRQTVLVAPTTVLAEQHCETFLSRFDGTPVCIEPLSRLQKGRAAAGTIRRIASGACDIVIGTHALLSENIKFKNLGLVIIDEEQRFGVRQKEALKRAYPAADVLTLSATPIPRTLYMSLTGTKDLSLLHTPPRQRVAVETIVARDSDQTIKAAIESEIARGGGVFCLYNRISTMDRVERRLRALVPTARIASAHGRMDGRTLAARVRAFERGAADVLLSTAIVESGVDIPRANTIVVFDSQMFGLADLYQLRGRVGRSSVRGRALFLLPENGTVDSDVRERLSALKKHSSSGAGFSIAMRDLEFRGAGDLLGASQSGHIATVGFTLYCQLLKRAIARLKGEDLPAVADASLNFDFIDLSPSATGGAAASLPFTYIEETTLRMRMMKRIAEATDARTLSSLAGELRDRFGPMPDPAKRLFSLAKLRLACASAGIGAIDVKGARAYFRESENNELAFVHELRGTTPDAKIESMLKAAKAAAARLRKSRRGEEPPR